jgi:serine/threonine-protein kinase
MDAARYEKLQQLFDQAVELQASERDAFLATVDTDLQQPLRDLLDADKVESLLDRGAAPAAGQALSEEFTGQQCGPYKLERHIGEGGMGTVFLGRRDDLQSVAAIKILRHAWMSPARVDRFLSEQRTLAELRHPAIATLFDANTLADGTPWFAMEFVDGVPITDYCGKNSPPLRKRLALFRLVCEAVRHAHSHAIIHRDLKPSNILVNTEGQVKLLDFGIAKQLTETDKTLTGVRLMTPAYAAPEQHRGEATGIYTDIYGLGVVLREILPTELSRSEKADLTVLCQKAVHAEPDRRYASVDALIRDLDHFDRGEPLEARPDSVVYKTSRFIRRNRLAVSAALAVALLIAFYTLRLRDARNQAVAEAAKSQRMMNFVLDLFQGGDAYAGPAAELKVQTVIDRGVDQARALNVDPSAQAELYRTLGGVQRKLGNLDKAEALLKTALDQRARLKGESHPEYIESLQDFARLRVEQARFDDAEKDARRALAIARETGTGVAGALETLGKVLEERGSYPEAITVLTEAVALRTDPKELAEARLGLANVHFYAGHFPEAEAGNRQVLEIYKALYGPTHPSVAEVLTNLGAIKQDTGQYAESEKLHRQALDIIRPFFGEDHPRTAASVTMIARVLIYLKRGDEAAVLLNRSLGIRERVYGPVHPNVASTLNELGNLALMNNRHDEGERYFRRVVAIYRDVYSGKHYLIGIGLANLGSAFMARKQWKEAEALFREALEMYAQTLAPGHFNIAITRIKLGRVLLRQKLYKQAHVETKGGFDILSKQSSPAVSWLNNARQDLAEEEKGMNGTL